MEEGRRKLAYGALLALSGLFAAAAAATLVPWPGASWPNVLGYRSLCTFAPMATAVCALLAAATCTVRARLFGPAAGRKRSWVPPIAAAVLLVAAGAFFLPAYLRVKVDSTTAASAQGQQ